MDYYDNSDILAPSARPVLRPSSSRSLAPSFWTLFRLAFFATLGTIAYYAFLHYKVHFNAWRERSHRLSMRRRYGIPDDDDRPFNVAFAAAHQARLAQSAKGPTPEARQGSQENFVPVRSGSLDGNGLRQRLNGNDRMSTPQLQSNHNHAAESAINQRNALLNNAPRNVNGTRPPIRGEPVMFEETMRAPLHIPGGMLPPTEVQSSGITGSRGRPAPAKSSLKRGLEDEPNTEASKRTRTGSKEIIDVDALEDEPMNQDLPQKRGAKRGPSPDEDEGYSSRQAGREKRLRRISRQNTDEDMDATDTPRGKKRDRGEAGSTFGGDDDYLDADDLTSSRRRRRRMERKRSDPSMRGTQLRGVPESEEDEEAAAAGQPSQHEEDSIMDEASISVDPLCKGRKIGEEWEEDGEHYKVGPNGQRLRQAYVKKSRTRFPDMPADSNHTDRAASWDIYIEKWVTDEEFEAAKAKFELAWQETPAGTPQSSEDAYELPPSPGKKSLLWASRSVEKDSHPTPKAADPSSTPPLNGNGARPNPFAKSRLGVPGRRVASPYASATLHTPAKQVVSTPPMDSPVKKTLSKWEKQEVEAQAMNRMRKQTMEEEARKAEAAKPPALPAAPAQGASSGTSSFFALPKPADKPATPVPAPSGETAKASESPKASAPPSFFSIAPASSSSAPASTPTSAAAPAPTAATASAAPAPSFSLPPAPAPAAAPPSKDAQPTPSFAWPGASATSEKGKAPSQPSAPAAPTAVPNFFGTSSKPTQAQAAPSSSGAVPDFFNMKGASAPAAGPSAPQSSGNVDMDTSTSSASAPTMTSTFFAPPTASTAPPSSPWASGTTSNPTSSSLFGAVTEQKKPEEQKAEQPPAAGGSLLSRMGGFSQPNTASPFGQPASAPSNSSGSIFGNPAASMQPEAGKTTSVFGAPPSTNTTTSAFGPSSTSNSMEAPKPKFKFDIPTRGGGASSAPPASQAQMTGGPVIAAAGPSMFANNGSSSGSTSTPKFSFGFASSSTPSNSNAMATDSPAPAPNPSMFAGPSAPSAAQPTSVFANPATSAGKAPETSKMSFTFPPATQSASSIFGKPATPASQPGQGSGQGAFSFGLAPAGSKPEQRPANGLFGLPSAPAPAPPAQSQTPFKFTFGVGSGSQPSSSAAPNTSVFANPPSSQPNPAAAPGASSQNLFTFPPSSTPNTWPPKPS